MDLFALGEGDQFASMSVMAGSPAVSRAVPALPGAT
jgi:hypothetical protein